MAPEWQWLEPLAPVIIPVALLFAWFMILAHPG